MTERPRPTTTTKNGRQRTDEIPTPVHRHRPPMTITETELQAQVDALLARLAADPVITFTVVDGEIDTLEHSSGVEILLPSRGWVSFRGAAVNLAMVDPELGDHHVDVWVDGFVNLWGDDGECVGEIDLVGNGPIVCRLEEAR